MREVTQQQPSPGRYARPLANDEDVTARLEQLEALVSKQAGMLESLQGLIEKLSDLQPRRGTPLRMAAADLTPMTDDEMVVGGQYMFRVANPRRPYFARAMVYASSEDPKTGAVVYKFMRPDTQRHFQPRPASEFYKLPKDWKDPADEAGEEASSRPVRRR